jgi:hypothetical protein
MEPSRRRLLWISFAAALGSLFTSASRGAQNPTPTPRGGRPRPEGPEDTSDTSNPNFPNPTKTMLEERQKIIKKDVEKLYFLASQLKAEVEKTDSTSVLSLAMLKKAEEIEKLAKQIKDHAKG